jgi:hypothetical protein
LEKIGGHDRTRGWEVVRFYDRSAVSQGNRSESVRVLPGQGALMQECGELDEAQGWFIKAARRRRVLA